MAATLSLSFSPAGASTAPSAVAITRCDAKNINEAQTQVQDWERHPARGTQDQLKRLADLQDTIAAMGEERGILEAVCPDTMSRAAYNSEIASVSAWAYALESDIAIALGPPCPSAGNVVPNQLLATAWYHLAANAAENGKTVPTVAAVVPKIQTRAAAINFTLPAFADTSSYWVDQATDAARTAIKACNLPPVTPSPSPTPVDTPNP